jgi:hypothetical protein
MKHTRSSLGQLTPRQKGFGKALAKTVSYFEDPKCKSCKVK